MSISTSAAWNTPRFMFKWTAYLIKEYSWATLGIILLNYSECMKSDLKLNFMKTDLKDFIIKNH